MLTDQQQSDFLSLLTNSFQSHKHLCEKAGIAEQDHELILELLELSGKIEQSHEEDELGDPEIVVRLKPVILFNYAS